MSKKAEKIGIFTSSSTASIGKHLIWILCVGIEGEAASVYFSVWDDLILQQKEHFCFSVRSRRPPLDRVNALLSFAYSFMTSMCTAALESVGLDPYIGFLHTDRPGRRSLALDLVEEFSSTIV